jgi:AAA domain-containing protein
MKLPELFQHYASLLEAEQAACPHQGKDLPIPGVSGRRVSTCGSLHLYEMHLPEGIRLMEDVPVTILPNEAESTEGFVVGQECREALVQTFDAIGETVTATVMPDAAGVFETARNRLEEMLKKPDQYCWGPIERLLPRLDPDRSIENRPTIASEGVLSTIWSEDLAQRRAQLAPLVIELVRTNKRLLLVSPSHHSCDELLEAIARAMRAAGLQYKSLLSRYEVSTRQGSHATLQELSFEAQVHQFYARSRSDKASLRQKFDRFRELTPFLAHKAEKQRDLDEVKLLEWRLLTQLSEVQAKIKEGDTTTAEYERIPVWKRLAMQTLGKNRASLAEYRSIYEGIVQNVLSQIEQAKHRIEELMPQAAIPSELRPEYNDLKEEIARLGGTKKIREMLAAEEGTNRQAFMQNKRVVLATAARVMTDPLFAKVRFDVLVADEAPLIPAPYLLAAAGLARERIILAGDSRDLPADQPWRLFGEPSPAVYSARPSRES